jgi:hypothetical protein
MNPITRRPGPGRGRPRKQPPGTLPGVATVGSPGVIPGTLPPGVAAPGQATMLPPGLPDGGPPVPHPDESLPLDASVDRDGDGEEDEIDERELKRPRLEDTTDPALEDEAVLNALAAHNNPSGVEAYATEYVQPKFFLPQRQLTDDYSFHYDDA